jgi:two-component system, NarL family, nitrate/nitrite response regulator NarL
MMDQNDARLQQFEINRRTQNGANSRRVLIVDKSPLRRAGLASMLKEHSADPSSGFEVTQAVSSLNAARVEADINLVLVSTDRTGAVPSESAAAIQEAKQLFPEPPLVVVSDTSDPADVIPAFRAGAVGFLRSDTDPSLMSLTLNFIVAGGVFFPPEVLFHSHSGRDASYSEMPRSGVETGTTSNAVSGNFTERQKEVLRLLRQGHSNKRIAIELKMCESTVKVHVRQIMRKLGVANRTQAALSAVGPSFHVPHPPEGQEHQCSVPEIEPSLSRQQIARVGGGVAVRHAGQLGSDVGLGGIKSVELGGLVWCR